MGEDDLDAESSAERDEVPAAVAAAAAAAPAIPSLAEVNEDPRNKFLLELFLFSVVSEKRRQNSRKM